MIDLGGRDEVETSAFKELNQIVNSLNILEKSLPTGPLSGDENNLAGSEGPRPLLLHLLSQVLTLTL